MRLVGSIAALEHLPADDLRGAAGAAVGAGVVGENAVADALLLVVAVIPPGAGDRSSSVVAVALVVEVPAPGLGGRLLGQHSQGSQEQQRRKKALHGCGGEMDRWWSRSVLRSPTPRSRGGGVIPGGQPLLGSCLSVPRLSWS